MIADSSSGADWVENHQTTNTRADSINSSFSSSLFSTAILSTALGGAQTLSGSGSGSGSATGSQSDDNDNAGSADTTNTDTTWTHYDIDTNIQTGDAFNYSHNWTQTYDNLGAHGPLNASNVASGGFNNATENNSSSSSGDPASTSGSSSDSQTPTSDSNGFLTNYYAGTSLPASPFPTASVTAGYLGEGGSVPLDGGGQVKPDTAIGIILPGGSGEVGLVGGAGATGAVGGGLFWGSGNPLTAGAYYDYGAFRGGPSFIGRLLGLVGIPWGYKTIPNSGQVPWAVGASAGLGGGLFISNATSSGGLRGPFDQYNLNIGFPPWSLGLGLSLSFARSGKIWIANGLITYGIAASISGYPTQTQIIK